MRESRKASSDAELRDSIGIPSESIIHPVRTKKPHARWIIAGIVAGCVLIGLMVWGSLRLTQKPATRGTTEEGLSQQAPELQQPEVAAETTPPLKEVTEPDTPLYPPVNPEISAGDKIVYLTFDDGPSQYTLDMINLLKQFNVKATFFVIGQNDELYKSIVDNGQAIALHSNAHNYVTVYASDQAFLNDLNAIGERVKNQVGFTPKIIRFPGGTSNTVSANYSQGIMTRLSSLVHDWGYKYYDWNCSVGDGASITPAEEIARVAGCNADPMYLLAHDTSAATLEAMNTIIPSLLERGYIFWTINSDTPECHHGINN